MQGYEYSIGIKIVSKYVIVIGRVSIATNFSLNAE